MKRGESKIMSYVDLQPNEMTRSFFISISSPSTAYLNARYFFHSKQVDAMRDEEWKVQRKLEIERGQHFDNYACIISLSPFLDGVKY